MEVKKDKVLQEKKETLQTQPDQDPTEDVSLFTLTHHLVLLHASRPSQVFSLRALRAVICNNQSTPLWNAGHPANWWDSVGGAQAEDRIERAT